MMTRANFHHVGLACPSIETELASLAVLGYIPEGLSTDDPVQRVRVRFLSGPGPRIELVEPTASDSPVQGLLVRGTKLYHFAYEVPEFDETIAFLEKKRFRAISPAVPAAAFGMRRIIFMMSRTSPLIELIDCNAQL
jgi:methylmalonyl-CoA/ethylmalonyl-CoA epimerase